jgi:hypothetical protein
MDVFTNSSFQTVGLNFFQGTSLTNGFSTALYLIWGIPYFRTVMRRVYLIELENLKKFSTILTST